jgi:glyoxalase family protein
MVHTIQWRVAGDAAIAFWDERLHAAGVATERTEGFLRFADPEGLGHELVAVDVADAPLAAQAPDVPAEHALLGFHGVRAYASRADRSAPLLEALGMAPQETDGVWTAQGDERHAVLRYEEPPAERGQQGAGTIHHIAWSVADDAELTEYRGRAASAGARATHIIDRQYFHSVYFREPSGVLFELASGDIGFDTDEPLESLGTELKLPPQHEHLRAELERRLTPLPDPRATTPAA